MDPKSQNYWQNTPQSDQAPVEPPQPRAASSPLSVASDQSAASPPLRNTDNGSQTTIPAATPVTSTLPLAPSVEPSKYSGYDLTAATPFPISQSPVPGDDATPAHPVPDGPITWEASEYIHHQKSTIWFVSFGAIVLVLLGFAVWLQAWTFVALIIVMAIAMLVFAVRSPRSLRYTLTAQGLQIDQRFYSYNDFKAFGILHDGGLLSVMLMPTKRFMPAITVYFAQEDGEKIVDMLGSRLPIEHYEQDPIDKFMRHLRF